MILYLDFPDGLYALDTQNHKIVPILAKIAWYVWKVSEECVIVWENMSESVWKSKILNALEETFLYIPQTPERYQYKQSFENFVTFWKPYFLYT